MEESDILEKFEYELQRDARVRELEKCFRLVKEAAEAL